MKNAFVVAACLLATTAITQPVFAANDQHPVQMQGTSAQKTVDQDFGKLSKDGAEAFRDLHLARLAIFNADPTKAKTEIASAQSALGKAKTDDAVFMKAESELKQPTTKNTSTTIDSAKSNQKIAWLPIDGQLSLGENFVSTPDKAKAVSDANQHLQKGERDSAVSTLKLAGIDVDFTMAVLPLDQTVADVNNAAGLIGQGKYYEANSLLKQTEDRMRFDSADASTVPQAISGKQSSTAAVTPAPTSTESPAALKK